MTYWSRYSRIAIGLGSSSSLTSLVSASSSSMISLHRSMHSSQIYTPGPAISLRTCFWLFPQKEHLSRSPPSPMRAMCPLDLLCVEPSRTRCLATVLTLPARHVEVACLSVTTRTRSVGRTAGTTSAVTQALRPPSGYRAGAPDCTFRRRRATRAVAPAPIPPARSLELAVLQHLVDQAVVLGLLRGEDLVPLDVNPDLVRRLVRVPRQDLFPVSYTHLTL